MVIVTRNSIDVNINSAMLNVGIFNIFMQILSRLNSLRYVQF